MTLLIRLFVGLLVGVLIAFITYMVLWPAPTFVGTYVAENKTGAYRLKIPDDATATLIYKDRKGKRFGYLGDVDQVDAQLTITWKARRVGTEWQPMTPAMKETLQVQADGQLKGASQLYRRATEDDKEI